MAYEETNWKNREVERPRTFTMQNNADGTITLIPAEGQIIEAGTPIVAVNMNKIEKGIKDAHDAQELHEADDTSHGVGDKISKSLATAASQFLVSSGIGAWAVKTIAEIKTLLGLKSAAYTESSSYATAIQGTKADNAMPKAGGVWSGESNHADNLVARAYLKDYAEVVGTTPATTGTVTFNLETGNTFNLSPTGNCTIAISSPPANGRAGSFTLRINMPATLYAITFPASFKWDKGTIPTLVASKIAVITGFTLDAGATWIVGAVGTEF